MKYRNKPNELGKAMVRARQQEANMNLAVIKAKKQQNTECRQGKKTNL